MMRSTLMATLLSSLVLAGCPSNPESASAAGAGQQKAAPTPAAPANQPASAPAAAPGAAAPAPGQNPSAPVAAGPAAGLTDGKEIFNRTCAVCHGMDGSGAAMRGMLPNIGDLTNPATHQRVDDAALTNLIKNGRNKMPAFSKLLNDEQIKAVIGYARTLQKK